MGIIFSTRERAVLEGYRLLFNKVASRNSKAGYANIVPDHTGVVEGVLYEIDERDLEKLDKYEEYPSHYGRLKVKVKLNNYET
ncbi:MAG: gamma-glutamylcyclotransferase, partial [Patescibacteria group bacterium]|nr:gamma-glutamylcyclotransferase [Patescibacteria group bacterium]